MLILSILLHSSILYVGLSLPPSCLFQTTCYKSLNFFLLALHSVCNGKKSVCAQVSERYWLLLILFLLYYPYIPIFLYNFSSLTFSYKFTGSAYFICQLKSLVNLWILGKKPKSPPQQKQTNTHKNQSTQQTKPNRHGNPKPHQKLKPE